MKKAVMKKCLISISVKHLDSLLKQGQLQLNKGIETSKVAGIIDLAVQATSCQEGYTPGLYICVSGVLCQKKKKNPKQIHYFLKFINAYIHKNTRYVIFILVLWCFHLQKG